MRPLTRSFAPVARLLRQALMLWAVVFAVMILVLGSACSSTTSTSGKPVAVATIFAYYDILRSVGGDKIDSQIVLPPGQSPHEYQPSLSDKTLVSHAQLFVMNGLGIDDQFANLLSDSSAKKLVISEVISKEEILHTEEIPLGDKPNAEEESHTLGNPHIWLDPAVQIKATEAIREALSQLDPSDKATFDANAQKYIADLQALDQQFKEAVKAFKSRDFIGFHSAYDYLAHRYGLHQVASIEEIPDAGLSLAQLQKILQIIKEKNIHYIAVETALNGSGPIDKIKAEAHVDTITLQPLETYDNPNDTYVSLMRQNLESLKKALN